MTDREWIARFGVPAPADEEVEQILRLAGIAAHASARTAAPVACWLAAAAGRPLAESLALAGAVAPPAAPG
jgi:hypothetical protein